MGFFKTLLNKFKKTEHAQETSATSQIEKKKTTLSDYANITRSTPETTSSSPNTPHATKPAPQPNQPTVSEVVSHPVTQSPMTSLDILVDALELNKKKIVAERGVITIPFDASGCDFDTKRQLALAAGLEYNENASAVPTNIACTEVARRIFRSIKASNNECYVCGCMFVSVSQDIDTDGYMFAEITNIHNGSSVFFDIPADITQEGIVNVDYDAINENIILSKNKVTS